MNEKNVIDKYKEWTVDLIRDDVQKHTFPYAVCMEQLAGDFNIGTLIRNSNAFGAREVYYIGRKKFDRRGAIGTYNYTSLQHLKDHEELKNIIKQKQYIPVAIDCIPGRSIPMESYAWPDNPILLFGEEGNGLSELALQISKDVVHITQYGSVRSLNVGTASGIAMVDLIRKKKFSHNV